jgi:hypothetical protein
LLRDPHSATVPPRLRLPRGPVAPLAELRWYGEQLQRIADGRPPRNGGSALLPLIRNMETDRRRAWRRRAYLAR